MCRRPSTKSSPVRVVVEAVADDGAVGAAVAVGRDDAAATTASTRSPAASRRSRMSFGNVIVLRSCCEVDARPVVALGERRCRRRREPSHSRLHVAIERLRRASACGRPRRRRTIYTSSRSACAAGTRSSPCRSAVADGREHARRRSCGRSGSSAASAPCVSANAASVAASSATTSTVESESGHSR